MPGEYEHNKLGQEYNQIYGTILREERKKRMISREELASGILSRTALENLESGKSGWRKLTGDTLLQRMGVATDYFEMVASADELDRWRMREDICLLTPTRPEEAEMKIAEYREKYHMREALEEQFLQKAELWLLLKRDCGEGIQGSLNVERLLEKAEKVVSCTVTGDWKMRLNQLWLSPAELEAVLLSGAARAACGRVSEAWELQRAVGDYPGEHLWKERMAVLILPQTSLLGIELALKEKDDRLAYEMGRDAVELLRRNCCHCYLLPLLDLMKRIPGTELGKEEQEYLKQMDMFRDAFEGIYTQFGRSGFRIWQGISVENTREAGLVLKMLRKFAGKSRAKAVYDGEEPVITQRQLEKIEKGAHKPSYDNYQRLVRQYGKAGGWRSAILETDSVEVLELRQQVATLVGLCEWKKAEWALERLRGRVDISFPRVKQEFLFFDALMIQRNEGDLEKCLERLVEALYTTVPNLEGKDKKWWVFQREEIIIAVNIADVCRKSGKLKEAKDWYEIIGFSLEQQEGRTGIKHTGYEIFVEGYDNFLGDLGRFEDAAAASETAARDYLGQPQIGSLARAFYRIAWNLYEMVSGQKRQCEMRRRLWENAFRFSQVAALFCYDRFLLQFLEERQDKFLGGVFDF